MAALELSEVSSGTFLLRKPGEMKWLYQSPSEQTFLVKNETLWLYQVQEKQVLIDKFRNVLLSDLPIAFLMGIGNISKDFSFVSGCVGSDGTVFELKGNGESGKNLSSFKLLIGHGSYLPTGARIADVGGNVTAIILGSLEIDAKLPVSIFEPDFPKGIDVQDRRQNSPAEKGSIEPVK